MSRSIDARSPALARDAPEPRFDRLKAASKARRRERRFEQRDGVDERRADPSFPTGACGRATIGAARVPSSVERVERALATCAIASPRFAPSPTYADGRAHAGAASRDRHRRRRPIEIPGFATVTSAPATTRASSKRDVQKIARKPFESTRKTSSATIRDDALVQARVIDRVGEFVAPARALRD